MCGRVEIARRASIASRRTTDSEAVSVGSGCEQRSHQRDGPDGLSQSAKLSALEGHFACVWEVVAPGALRDSTWCD